MTRPAPGDDRQFLTLLDRAGLKPADPLWLVLENQYAQGRHLERMLTELGQQLGEACAAIEKTEDSARERAAQDLHIIAAEKDRAIALVKLIRVQTEEFGRNQAVEMTGAVVNETLASLRAAVFAMWKQELPSTILELLHEFRVRWIVIGLMVILGVMGIGAGIAYKMLSYPARIGTHCLSQMIADKKDAALWCQLDWMDIGERDRQGARKSSNH
ncbi:MAG: hypothetical protein ABF479_01100 [Gluconacetobacter sp.]